LEEFLKPNEITQYRLAKDINVPARRINEIVLRKRAISADTALRLSRYFGNTPQFWLSLQDDFDLETQSAKLGKKLLLEVKVLGKTVKNLAD
jgi:antitoxin HigA-1